MPLRGVDHGGSRFNGGPAGSEGLRGGPRRRTRRRRYVRVQERDGHILRFRASLVNDGGARDGERGRGVVRGGSRRGGGVTPPCGPNEVFLFVLMWDQQGGARRLVGGVEEYRRGAHVGERTRVDGRLDHRLNVSRFRVGRFQAW